MGRGINSRTLTPLDLWRRPPRSKTPTVVKRDPLVRAPISHRGGGQMPAQSVSITQSICYTQANQFVRKYIFILLRLCVCACGCVGMDVVVDVWMCVDGWVNVRTKKSPHKGRMVYAHQRISECIRSGEITQAGFHTL